MSWAVLSLVTLVLIWLCNSCVSSSTGLRGSSVRWLFCSWMSLGHSRRFFGTLPCPLVSPTWTLPDWLSRWVLTQSLSMKFQELLRSFRPWTRWVRTPVLEALVADAHGHTWFTTHGLSNAVHARLGSRAGDPFGDFIFGCLLARATSDVEHRMRHEGRTPGPRLPEARSPFRAEPEAHVMRGVP